MQLRTTLARLHQPNDQLFHHLVDAVDEYAIYLLDPGGIVATWNPGAQRNKGYRAEEIIGRHYSCFFTPEDRDRGCPELELRMARVKGRFHEEGWRVKKDGSLFWAEIVLTPVRDETGSLLGFAKVTRDLTERRNKDLKLREALEAAEQSSLAKADFLANMSHELRTPLNAVIGFSEILSTECFGPVGNARYREYADDIHKSGTHLLGLINDILDLSKLDAGALQLQRSDIDLAEVAREAIDMIRHLAERAQISILARLHPAPYFGDRQRLKQVLLNLLSNAIKFTPADGIVEIAVDRGDNCAIVTVRDNGIGIRKEDIERAMARFGQIESGRSRNYQGTGLGLPISKEIVQLHGGELTIDSELGSGTTITVQLSLEDRAQMDGWAPVI